MTVPEASVAVELERLRGTVSTGFAEVKGSLTVLVERSARNEQDLARLREETERDIAALRADHDKDCDELRAEVEALKKTRWPLQSVNALIGLGALVVAVLALIYT